MQTTAKAVSTNVLLFDMVNFDSVLALDCEKCQISAAAVMPAIHATATHVTINLFHVSRITTVL
jgi:hypothetical protein